MQLTSEGWEGSPVWSPDGSKIAFIKAIRASTAPKVWKGELWVMNADGTSQVRIAENVHAPPAPSWSPDSQRLVYVVVNDEGPNEIMVTDLGRGEQKVVATGDDQGAAWLMGERIAFVRDGQLVLKDLDTGTEQVREEIEFTGNRWETAFMTSPDGTRLAHIDRNGALWIVDLATMEMVQANSDQDRISLHEPYGVAWSPDGHSIAYITGMSKLWVADARTGMFALLLEEHAHFRCPTWSPDGHVLAFSYASTGSNIAPYIEIYLVNRDGSGLRNLTENEQMEDCPSWSPDGNKFAFTRLPTYSPGVLEKYLWELLLQYD